MISGNLGLPQRLEPLENSHPSKLVPALDDVCLPPFEVLLKWLTYYHAQTGTWPEPGNLPASNTPVAAPINPTQHVVKPCLKVLSGKSARKESAEAAQPPIKNPSSHYDLKSSVYYRTARELVDQYAPTFSPLDEATLLTLASVVAWCHYPTFATQYSKSDFGAKPGMYLPLGEWSKELKMRKARLANCLKELEEVGLLYIEMPFSEKAGKNCKRTYRLAVPLTQALPVFESSNSKVANNLELREPQKLVPEPEVTRFRTTGTENTLGTTDMSHVINNKNLNTYKNQNHEHEVKIEPGTIEEKYTFLTEQAFFPGYISPDGLITLDKREAHKFAATTDFDLVSLKKIYQQSLAAWTAGKCRKNPIGFFHNSLTRYLNQKPAARNQSAFEKFGNAVPGTTLNGNHMGLGTAIANQPDPRPTAISNFTRHQPIGFPRNIPPKGFSNHANTIRRSTPYKASELEDITEQTNYVNLEGGKDIKREEVDKGLIERSLQQNVVEALQNRFKNSYLAEILTHLTWDISFMADRLHLELRNKEPGFLATTALGQGSLSLLKIAVSQCLRTLAHKSLEVEIVVE